MFTPNHTVLVQGILTPLGRDCTQRMKAYGTPVAAGTSVGSGGQNFEEIPIYHLVEEALAADEAIATSVICLPPYQVLDAALEALEAGLRQLVVCTSGIPPGDMLHLVEKARQLEARVLGPGSAGAIVPEEILLGGIAAHCYCPGNVGILARTDTLMDEIAWELTQADLGQSLAVNLGTAGITGSGFGEWLPVFEEDEHTEVILLLDLDVTSDSNEFAEVLKGGLKKPVVAYVAGGSLPHPDNNSDGKFVLADYLAQPAGSAKGSKTKVAALKKAKVAIANRPAQIASSIQKVLQKKSAVS